MLTLRADQEEGADFLYEHDRALILAPVGAGKTAITLTAMYDMVRDGHVKRWLVVAPKRVCTTVWPVELKKWKIPLSMSIAVAEGKASMPKDRRDAALRAKAQVLVVNYDTLQTLPEGIQFDGVVFDELTKLKNPSGKRYKAMLKTLDKVRIRWGLTASFTSNGLEDVFGQCKMIDQGVLGRSKGAFMQKYFIPLNPRLGMWTPRPGALALVMSTIKPITYQLSNTEYVDSLPPLHIVPITCEMDLAPYKKLQRECVLELKGQTITAVNAGVVSQKLQQLSAGFLYQTEKTVSQAPGKFIATKKAHWVSSHKFNRLEELLEENQRTNTIIVYWYQEELAELKRRYPQAVAIDEKHAIERWNAGKIELLLVHPGSAGHGLNLQDGGCTMIFTSLPWSQELFEQVVGRLHRGGQRHDVWVYLLLTDKTIDLRIWERLQNKKDYSALALDALN
jgi:superfamily II DNA or RNA helicase